MKRYQLIGRKKTAQRRFAPEYNKSHLHSLPLELLIQIFNHLRDDIRQLLTLCLVCQKFNGIISKYYIYKLVRFNNIDKFLTFTHIHLPNKRFGVSDSSTKINFIQSIEFINPPVKDSKDFKTKIAGSYDVESSSKSSNRMTFDEFTTGLEALMREDYNLKQITILEISPQFAFDDTREESSFLKKHKKMPKRTLHKLILKAQTGWSILFKLNHLSDLLNVYDSIEELELHNFIIDGVKLSNVTLLKPLAITLLIFDKCCFMNRSPRGTFCDLFKYTTAFQMCDIVKSADLSMIDFIKSNNCLNYLSLDLGSGIFYENSSFNFRAFNPFFKLICSRLGAYAQIKILALDNFDLLYQYNHNHGESSSKTENLTELLRLFSSMPFLLIRVKYTPKTIHTCKKCGFLKTEESTPLEKLTKRDWSTLLKPLIDNDAHFKILSHKLELLYENT